MRLPLLLTMAVIACGPAFAAALDLGWPPSGQTVGAAVAINTFVADEKRSACIDTAGTNAGYVFLPVNATAKKGVTFPQCELGETKGHGDGMLFGD